MADRAMRGRGAVHAEMLRRVSVGLLRLHRQGAPTRPSSSNIESSWLFSLLGVVRRVSPVKMELAPAMKHSAWSAAARHGMGSQREGRP